MPNWCNNDVTIYHKDPAKIKALAEAIKDGNFCKSVKPIPEALANTTSPNRENAAELVEATGYADWYDYCVNEWGTKWDVDPYDTPFVDENTIQFGFDSAWSPPTGIYEELVAQGYEVRATYYEPGMCYVGRWDNGNDEYYEYSDYDDPDDVREFIGEELDDAYGISDSMREYLADEEE